MGHAQEEFRVFDIAPELIATKGGYQPRVKHHVSTFLGAEVNIYKNHMIVMLVFVIAIYAVSILITMNCTTDGKPCNVALVFLLFHCMFMFGVSYLILKKNQHIISAN